MAIRDYFNLEAWWFGWFEVRRNRAHLSAWSRTFGGWNSILQDAVVRGHATMANVSAAGVDRNYQIRYFGWSGFFYNAIQRPLINFFKYKPSNVQRGDAAKLNGWAICNPIRWFDCIFEMFNGVFDFLATRGLYVEKDADNKVNKRRKWWGYLLQGLAFLLRLPFAILQNAWNLVVHPYDSWIKPFVDIYRGLKAGTLGVGTALLLGFMQCLKVALVGLALATVFGAPLAVAINSAISSVLDAVLNFSLGTIPIIGIPLSTSAVMELTPISALSDLSLFRDNAYLIMSGKKRYQLYDVQRIGGGSTIAMTKLGQKPMVKSEPVVEPQIAQSVPKPQISMWTRISKKSNSRKRGGSNSSEHVTPASDQDVKNTTITQ